MEPRNAPDLRDWSRLTSRVRLAATIEIGAMVLVSALVIVGAMTIGVGLSLIGVLLVLLVLVFDSRRPWWPPEPNVHYIDPLAAHAMRWVVVGASLVAVGVAFDAVGLR